MVSLNLRTAAVSVGPVLLELRRGLAMSPAAAGVLTALPVLAFAVFGAVAPWLARVVGVHRVTLISLSAVTVGMAVRVTVDSAVPFLAWSLLALAGMATANVLLPSLVKLHFPDRVGAVTAVYTTALALGLTAALTLTAPLAGQLGGWRHGLGSWAVLALVATVPWLRLVGHDRHLESGPEGVRLLQVARTRLGMAMAVFFGLQSLQAYSVFGWFAQLWRDSGYSATEAGGLVGLLAGVSIPLSLVVPAWAARLPDQRVLLVAIMACYPIGYVGMLWEPHRFAVVWAVIIGIGACTFPLILTMLGLRSRTPGGTAALSGFTQSLGYLIAAAGPFAMSALYDATGGWTWPLWLLLSLMVPQLLTGWYSAGPRFVEDQLVADAATGRLPE